MENTFEQMIKSLYELLSNSEVQPVIIFVIKKNNDREEDGESITSSNPEEDGEGLVGLA